MAVSASHLDAGSLKQMRYAPERFPDALVDTIAAASSLNTPPLVLTSLQQDGFFVRMDELATVPATTPADVTIQAAADGVAFPPSGYTLSTDQLPSIVANSEGLGLTATRSAQLQFANAGTASATNFQAAWHLWGWRPTLADYITQGVSPPAELSALQHLLPAGFVPAAIPERMIAALFARPQVLPFAGTASVKAGGDTPITLASGTPPAGWFDVVRFIAVDDSVVGTISLADRVANAVLVSIARDGTDPLRTYPATGLQFNPVVGAATLDTSRINGTRPFIVSRAAWRVYLTATNAVNNIPYLVVSWRLREQPEHRILWNVATNADLALTRNGVPLKDLIASGVF